MKAEATPAAQVASAALSVMLSEEQRAAVAAWHVGAVLAASVPNSGTVNTTVLLETRDGRYALRAYRHTERGPVAREHAIIAHVRAHGLPAVAPLPLPDGATILERDGRFFALFPCAPGRQVARAELGVGEAAAMGRFLARLHGALNSLPAELATQRPIAIDRARTLARMEHLEAVIRARTDADPVHAAGLARLAAQREWVRQLLPSAAVDFGALEQQVVHGDYQETNLFFAASEVCAVIDWDQTHVRPRAWEVLRTLHYAFAFAPALCRPLLAAYRGVLPLPLEDLDCAAAAYDIKARHDLWLYETFYLERNPRVRPFLLLPAVAPVADQWATLRAGA